MKKYEVAIIYNRKGDVIGCLKCKMVDENEYKDLVSKTQKTLESQELEKINTLKYVEELSKSVNDLKKEIKHLKGEEQ